MDSSNEDEMLVSTFLQMKIAREQNLCKIKCLMHLIGQQLMVCHVKWDMF